MRPSYLALRASVSSALASTSSMILSWQDWEHRVRRSCRGRLWVDWRGRGGMGTGLELGHLPLEDLVGGDGGLLALADAPLHISHAHRLVVAARRRAPVRLALQPPPASAGSKRG